MIARSAQVSGGVVTLGSLGSSGRSMMFSGIGGCGLLFSDCVTLPTPIVGSSVLLGGATTIFLGWWFFHCVNLFCW